MAIALRDDYDAARLRHVARDSDDADQVRRLLALAAIYDGSPRAEAAQIGGVTRQIVRDWVLRFNEVGPDGLTNRKAPGKPPLLGSAERKALAAVIEATSKIWRKEMAHTMVFGATGASSPGPASAAR